jgi:hypothetical protein
VHSTIAPQMARLDVPDDLELREESLLTNPPNGLEFEESLLMNNFDAIFGELLIHQATLQSAWNHHHWNRKPVPKVDIC